MENKQCHLQLILTLMTKENMRGTVLLVALLLAVSQPAAADNDGIIQSVAGFVRKVGTFIDSLSVRGVDRHYIESPDRPWQIIAKGNVSQTDLKMRSTVNIQETFPELRGYWLWESHIKTDPSTYVGFWAGYRGYGLGYSVNVGGDKGTNLTLGAMGGSYGLNFRIHRFETDETTIHFTADMFGEQLDIEETGRLDAPINVRTLIADGYYLFNGRHFSYAAAYDQSVIQLRSAGSLLVGGMYYYSHMNFSQPRNAYFINAMNDMGRIKQWQGNIGVGYAYNFVPAKGWLISAMAIPMLTFYNRIKIWRYDSNMFDIDEEDDVMREKVENGEISNEEYEVWWEQAIDRTKVWDRDQEVHYSNIRLNYDARLSLTYHWDRYFFNVYGQFNNFRYGHGDASGRLNDWFVNASLGIRL